MVGGCGWTVLAVSSALLSYIGIFLLDLGLMMMICYCLPHHFIDIDIQHIPVHMEQTKHASVYRAEMLHGMLGAVGSDGEKATKKRSLTPPPGSQPFRSRANSLPGAKVPIGPCHPGQFALWNFRSTERIGPGAKRPAGILSSSFRGLCLFTCRFR